MTDATDPDRRDAIDVLIDDHRAVDRLLDRYEAIGPDVEAADLVHDVAMEISLHAAVEEEHLHPTIRDRLPEGEELVRAGLEAHREIGGMIGALLSASPDDPAFVERAAGLVREVRSHLALVEDRTIPELRRGLDEQQLEELGEVLESARSAVRPR